ncbi:uncharacterized protein LOC114532148 [Dendronephthya gigantea]|uniref:uncharacterized protein LOC114532148 n=1 Tax=Dendronephthya gigantea TaxID=151771 RepID=UPI00106D6AF3|nr:uncharacterized protein LOC114532148 [Dendronephthya gigantea]
MILNTETMTKIFQMKMITTGVIFGFLFFHCASGLKIEKPRNLRATVNGSKVLIKWQPSVPTQGDAYYYVVTWKRTNKNETEDYAIADNDNSFVRDFGNATGLYTIGVQAGNNVGIRSEFAYLYNVSIGGNYTITTQSTKLTTAQHSNTTTHTHELLKRTNPTAMSMPLIAGGSTGAFVFLCLAVFIFLFLLRKIQKKRRDRSIQEFESRWFEINLQKTNAAIERPNRSSG